MLVTAPVSPPVGVGYQDRDVDTLTAELMASGVSLIVDVRLNPISRKPGFSKRALTDALEAAGIAYEHAPELGNPKWNRYGFAGTAEERRTAQDTYARMLTSNDTQARLDELAEAATRHVIALFCFEKDESRCHR